MTLMQLSLFLLLSFCGLLVFAAGLMAKDVPMEPTKPDQRKRREILTKLEQWFSRRSQCADCYCHVRGFILAKRVSHTKCPKCQEQWKTNLSLRTDANTAVQ